MNIIINSWPSTGGTTVGLLLSYFLNYKHLDSSETFKLLAAEVYRSNSLQSYGRFEVDFGASWDKIWESYILWKIRNDDEIVISGRITGFFAEDIENLIEVMLIANTQARIARSGNKRDYVAEQDNFTRQRWFSRFNIDLFNLSQVELNYDLIIDNSYMKPGEELYDIFEFLKQNEFFDDLQYKDDTDGKVEEIVRSFLAYGIKFFLDKQFQANKIIHPNEVLKDWNKYFKKDVDALPEPFRAVVKKYQ